VSWSRPFDDPIPLPGGGYLVTLKDAARHFQELPAAEQLAREWEIAAEILMDTAEGRDFLMHARIATLRALNRQLERVFTDRNGAHWGKRKLKRDQ
jgi:hypothetical protein